MATSAFSPSDLIYSYSRSQALNDGVLIPADPDLCREAGFKIPIAITDHLWGLIEPGNLDEIPSQSVTGRLWDLLWMFRLSVSDPKNHGKNQLRYKLVLLEKKPGCPCRLEQYDISAVCGPGDQGEPVITLMLPEDD